MNYNLETAMPLVCFHCLGGSRAYGLNRPESDTDYRGVFLAPVEDVLLDKVPLTVHDPKGDTCFHELGNFCRQLLRCSPSILEILYSMGKPGLEVSCSGFFRDFFAGRQFLNKKAAMPYMGYLQSELKQALSLLATIHKDPDDADTRLRFNKKMMHSFRLSLQGMHVAETGTLEVNCSKHRDFLLGVRAFNGTPAECMEMFEEADSYKAKLDAAFAKSDLPDECPQNGVLMEDLAQLRLDLYCEKRFGAQIK